MNKRDWKNKFSKKNIYIKIENEIINISTAIAVAIAVISYEKLNGDNF